LPRHKAARAADRDTRSDAELIAAVRAGNQAAFGVIYDRYFQRVFNFAYTRLHNRADAEEAVQDTFAVVFRSMDAYRGQATLLSWVYGIAKNTVNNQIRRNRAHEMRLERAQAEISAPAHAMEELTPEERLSFRRCADAVEAALTSVTSWQAEVFALRHFENLPIQEIADRMCRSNDAVRSSLYRMKRLVVEAVDGEYSSAG
jgi:RNA polymerase sigma-70 factor (ECF subfamily)